MSFISALRARNLEYVVDRQLFKPIVPQNGKRFAELIKRIVDENLRVYVDYDCDPDGFFSFRILMKMFELCNFTNYTYTKHTVKRHVLSESFVWNLSQEKYDVVFILDSSTNDMNAIKTLTDAGSIVCVVDHHESHYKFNDYPPSAVIVNPRIDRLYQDVVYDCLSAGAVCSLLCAFTLKTVFNIQAPTDMFLYGVVTLYSDIMDLSNAYNIAFISRYMNTQLISSPVIKLFWNEAYDHFDSSYISFKLIPRLNALFRTENFALLQKVFFSTEDLDYDALAEQIEEIYKYTKQYTEFLVSSCNVLFETPTLLTVCIPQQEKAYTRNFTGLVANKFASAANKTTICFYDCSAQKYTGSVRDPFSRDIRVICSSCCYAEGHPAAFGIEISKSQSNIVLPIISDAISALSQDNQNLIIMNWDDNPDFKKDLQLMAEYNEFGGQGLPAALGALTIKPYFKIHRDPKKKMIYGDGEKFICFAPTVDTGDVMLIKPTLSGSDYKNIVNNVSLTD